MVVTTGEVVDIKATSAKVFGNVIDFGEGVKQHGHCYSTHAEVTISDSKTTLGLPGSEFSSQIENLQPGTTYFVNAYLSNGDQTVYGKEVSFTTIEAVAPSITTNPISSITSTTALGGGNISDDGGAMVYKRGLCWSTSHLPVTSDSSTEEGTGIGEFSSPISGLLPNQLYYIRAYAINEKGTAYGLEVSFKTELKVGDRYLGGIVAYILQNGDAGFNENVYHGLIAATRDLTTTTTVPWDMGTQALLGASGSAIGTGKTNTDIIISKVGYWDSYAAGLCDLYTTDGFGDWYLPSIAELEKLYLNKDLIGGFSTGSILTHLYWSSTELDSYNAYYVFFDTGNSAYGGKPNPCRVRPVRSF